MKKSIRIIALVLAVVLVIAAVFILRSCMAPPKYEEIEARFKELMSASVGVNEIVFGEGLPTYDRVYDPRDSVNVHYTGEYYIDDKGDEKQRKVWYYYTLDKENTIIAFRDSYIKDYSYALVVTEELSAEALAALFPAGKDDKTEYYGEVYRSEESGDICYHIPYVEVEAEFYYLSEDVEDYDYIRDDAEYRTIDEIKTYIESVYSRNYANSLYGSLFDGVASGDLVLKARYAEQSHGGVSMLAKSNTYAPLYIEERVYLFDTAEILYWQSTNKEVCISIDSYLPSNPDKIQNLTLTLTLQNGVWYLDSPTF